MDVSTHWAIAHWVTAVSYFAIPLQIIVLLIRLRAKLPRQFWPVCVLFAAFISTCGTHHAIAAFSPPHAAGLHLIILDATALTSAITAGYLIPFCSNALIYIKESENQQIELVRTQTLLELFFNNSPVAAYAKDSQSRMLFYNKKLAERFQVSQEEWIGRRDNEFLPEAVGNVVMENDHQVLRSGFPLETIEEVATPDGRSRYWLSHKFRFTDPQTLQECVGGVSIDVTGRQEIQRSLESVNRELEAKKAEVRVLNEMASALQSCNTKDEAYQVISLAVKRLFSDTSGAIYILDSSKSYMQSVETWGDEIEEIFAPDSCWAARRGQINVIEPSEPGLTCGHLSIQALTKANLCSPLIGQTELIGILYVQRAAEFSEAEIETVQTIARHASLSLNSLELKQSLLNQSNVDALTGLFNRRYMELTLDREFAKAERNMQSIGMIFLDLDSFSAVNNNYGHLAGDKVLREVSRIVTGAVRASDVAARNGGEEIVVVLLESGLSATVAKADLILERIRSHLVNYEGQIISVTASAGVAMYPENAPTWRTLLKTADAAMYRAKARGKDRVEVYRGAPAEIVEG